MFNSSEANLTSYLAFSSHFYYLPHVILISVVAISAVISNLVFLIAVFRNPVRYRVRDSPVSLLVVNLGVCDLLTAVVPGCGGIYYNLSLLRGRAREDLNGAIIMINTFGVISCIVSTCTISAMSLERFHAISSPLRHRARYNNLRIKAFLALSWIYSISFACLSMALSYRVFVLLYCHVHVTLPLIILPVVNWKTFTALRFHNQNKVGNLTVARRGTRTCIDRNSERKLLSAILLVVVLFYVTVMPFYIALNISALRPSLAETRGFEIFLSLSSRIILVNCVFNPFIYSWRIPKYRRAFKEVFGRCGCCRRMNTVQTVRGMKMEQRTLQLTETHVVLPTVIERFSIECRK